MHLRKIIGGVLLLSALTSGCALYDGFSDQAQWNTRDKTPDSSSDMRVQNDMTPDQDMSPPKDMPDDKDMPKMDMGDQGMPQDDMTRDMADMTDMVDMADMGTPKDPDTVKQLSLGASFTCALYHGGYVKCWGKYAEGQLGYEPSSNAQSWQPNQKVTGLTDVVHLSSGYNHTCATTKAGDVYCWGDNEKGQLGAKPLKDPNDPNVWLVPPTSATPRKVEFSTPQTIVETSGGAVHSCAHTTTGDVYCWGDSSWGLRGSNQGSDVFATQANLIDAIATRGGQLFACALKRDLRVMCWGYNYHGELGRRTNMLSNSAPDFATDVTKAYGLWTGTRYACITRDATPQGRELACWGWFPTRIDLQNTQQPTLLTIDGIGDAQEMALSDQHACALRDDGTVYCWGRGIQLGRGNNPDNPDVPQSTLLQNIVHIAGIGGHVCALNNNDQVFCWGNNGQGQLGDGTVSDKGRPNLVSGL